MNQNIKKNRKIVLITGAARRLGKAIALKLHSSGMDIIIHCNKSEKDAKKLVSDMNLLREDSAKYISLNLRDFKKYENFLPSLGDRWENIDVLINNASTFYPNQIDKSSLENWNDLQDVNLKSTFFLSKIFYNSLKINKGCIINIIDIHADKPLGGFSIYSIAIAGLKMLTKSLAVEFGPDIRVNGISPGSIIWPEIKEYESEHQAIIDKTLLKRQGSTNDIANACIFLINSADYITGQIINIDGGSSLNN